jgi:hypothetical protein
MRINSIIKTISLKSLIIRVVGENTNNGSIREIRDNPVFHGLNNLNKNP